MSGSTWRKLAGLVEFRIDDTVWDVASDLAWSPDTIQRTSVVGQSGPEGWTEAAIHGYISARLYDRPDMSTADLNRKEHAMIEVKLGNGKALIGTDMRQVGDIEVNTADSTFTIRFEGTSVTEQLGA